MIPSGLSATSFLSIYTLSLYLYHPANLSPPAPLSFLPFSSPSVWLYLSTVHCLSVPTYTASLSVRHTVSLSILLFTVPILSLLDCTISVAFIVLLALHFLSAPRCLSVPTLSLCPYTVSLLSAPILSLHGTALSFSVPTLSFLPNTDSVPTLSLCPYKRSLYLHFLFVLTLSPYPYTVSLFVQCFFVFTLSLCPYTVSPALHCLSVPTQSFLPYTDLVPTLSLCPYKRSLYLHFLSVLTLSLCAYTVSLSVHCFIVYTLSLCLCLYLFLSLHYLSSPTLILPLGCLSVPILSLCP
jgi:hypothetical protein